MKIIIPIVVILFILKILGLIQLGWFWVITSIIWIPLLILFVEIFILGFLVAAITTILVWLRKD